MRPETLTSLTDVVRAAELIQKAMLGVDLEAYLGNWEKQSAIERQLLIIGEALIRIRTHENHVFESIPDARKIVGLRNLLSHGYEGVDPVALYSFTKSPLSKLLAEVAAILPQA